MRHIILALSMGSVIAYGYALAGWGIIFLGREINYPYVIGGLVGGSISAILAIWLWKLWLRGEEDACEKSVTRCGITQHDNESTEGK
jgi:hypothetical protein